MATPAGHFLVISVSISENSGRNPMTFWQLNGTAKLHDFRWKFWDGKKFSKRRLSKNIYSNAPMRTHALYYITHVQRFEHGCILQQTLVHLALVVGVSQYDTTERRSVLQSWADEKSFHNAKVFTVRSTSAEYGRIETGISPDQVWKKSANQGRNKTGLILE